MSKSEVLNECVVGRGEVARPVRLTAEIDGRYLTTYVADGVIAATPTSSTAYALAAGGPILPRPAQHPAGAGGGLTSRWTGDHPGRRVVVRLTIHTDHPATLSVDGHPPERIADGELVTVRASEHSASFVRIQDPGYFYRNLTSRMSLILPPETIFDRS